MIQQLKEKQQNDAQEKIMIEKNEGQSVTQQYSIGKVMGGGILSQYYEIMTRETMEALTAKIVKKNSLSKARDINKLRQEVKILKSLNHPGIINLENYFEDHQNIYFIHKSFPSQTLNDYLNHRGRLTENEVSNLVKQIIKILLYLQEQLIIHRNLKLSNILLTKEKQIKIFDFSQACKLDTKEERRKTICGSQNYLVYIDEQKEAPEILDGGGYSFEVDVWYLGIITYTLLVGESPFESSNIKEAYQKIRQDAISYPSSVEISEAGKDLVQRLLQSDPFKRINLQEIFIHPFLTVL